MRACGRVLRSCAWTVAVLVRRTGAGTTVFTVLAVMTVLSLAQVALGTSLLGRTPDLATPVIAVVAGLAAVRLDRALWMLPTESTGPF